MHIPDWVPDAIFYQIFPDRFRNGDPSNDPAEVRAWEGAPSRESFFGGDLQGVIDALGYVRDLGCDAIYLNPIFTAGSNHKYDTFEYRSVDPALGDDATFDRLIAEAHARGIRIVLDGVFNHCGIGFAPFRDVLVHGAASRYRDWFDVYDFPVRPGARPNYATCGGAHYLPRLNARNPEVEAFVHEVALHWLGRGIDGWRLDVPYEIDTPFWRRFRSVVKERHPDAYLLAEEWRDPSAFLGGDTFDGATHYLLRGLLLDFLAKRAITGEAFLRALTGMIERLPAGSASGMLTLLGSHDTPRALTEFGGNASLLGLALTCIFTLPGAPLVYYGDENGMTGGDDPACRAPMIWDERRWNTALRGDLRRLIALRRRLPCLRRGDIEPGFANDGIVSYERACGDERVLVVLNATPLPRDVRIPVRLADGTAMKDLLCGGEHVVSGGAIDFAPMPPLQAWVLSPAHAPEGLHEPR